MLKILQASEQKVLSGVSINSKKIKKNNLFIAIKGRKNDAHDFLDEAIDNGEYLTVEHKDDYVHHVYEYSTKHPTALNASEVIHGVINTERRVFINFSGYLDWKSI